MKTPNGAANGSQPIRSKTNGTTPMKLRTTPVTQRTRLSHLSAMCSLAIRRGYLVSNRCLRVERVRVVRSRLVVLTPDQAGATVDFAAAQGVEWLAAEVQAVDRGQGPDTGSRYLHAGVRTSHSSLTPDNPTPRASSPSSEPRRRNPLPGGSPSCSRPISGAGG
jgi:hypothetical protein